MGTPSILMKQGWYRTVSVLGMASLERKSASLITLILIAASGAKKAALEDAKPGPEAVRTVECSKGPSLEPGAQLEEKKISEVALGSQHSSELEKRLDRGKAVEESQEAGQVESSALQESPRARAEAVFLHEMVRGTPCLVHLVESSFSQELVVQLKVDLFTYFGRKNLFLPKGLEEITS